LLWYLNREAYHTNSLTIKAGSTVFQRLTVILFLPTSNWKLWWAVDAPHCQQQLMTTWKSSRLLLLRNFRSMSSLCLQLSWRALSSEHPNLKPVQLHRILTQYQLTAEIGPVPTWQPSSEDEAYIYRTGMCVCISQWLCNHVLLPSKTLAKLWHHKAWILSIYRPSVQWFLSKLWKWFGPPPITYIDFKNQDMTQYLCGQKSEPLFKRCT